MENTWLSKAVTFNPSIISESDRTIRGIATAPVYDFENELITQEAVSKALNDFMELPILTYNHLEFPCGIVTKAEFDGAGRLVIEAKLKKAKSVDDIWALVKSGVLNSFSIAGRRTESTCRGDGNACVTKGLHINAVTLCSNPCNPEAKFEVRKDMTNTEEVKKSEESDGRDYSLDAVMKSIEALNAKIDGMAQPKVEVEKSDDDKKDEEKSEKDADMKKSLDDVSKKLEDMSALLKSMDERLTNVENRKVEKAMITIDDEGKPIGATISPMESYAKHLFGNSKF